jgi:site-specific recombinase XerD
VQRIVNEKVSTRFAQRNFLNTLRAMFKWAAKEGRMPDDPTLGVSREKAKTTGYKTWSEADIERFEAAHPIGTKAWLAFALILYTGFRRSDVIKIGRAARMRHDRPSKKVFRHFLRQRQIATLFNHNACNLTLRILVPLPALL